MRALTVKQPWAELIITGLKDVENRSRRTTFRGRFAVHTGLRRAELDDLGLEHLPAKYRKRVTDAWQRHGDRGGCSEQLN